MNPFRDIWNIDYIQQVAGQQHHLEQEYQVAQTTMKLQDFLSSWDKIDPQHQSQAVTNCCIVILDYLSKHTNLN